MIRLHNIKVSLDASHEQITLEAAKKLGITRSQIESCSIGKKSVDARKKSDIRFVVSLDIRLKKEQDENRLLKKFEPAVLSRIVAFTATNASDPFQEAPTPRPVVVGMGPAGLFAALVLAEAGAQPIILERGFDVDTRTKHVRDYWENGQRSFNPESNVQFGEGGAGTFSDGKLNTGTKDIRQEYVFQTFVKYGAPDEILIRAKPHIGTDKLVNVVRAIRSRIIDLGGEVHFGAKLVQIRSKEKQLSSISYEDAQGIHEIPAENLILAIGHSARDTFAMLYDNGFSLTQKPFSIGVRIEHPQLLINQAQYGSFAEHPKLGAADYKLAIHLPSGRNVYTFCMCPGGSVVAAASEPNSIVTNGMSCFARDQKNANSALLVGIGPEDFASSHPLAGMFLQREIEQRAFVMGGCTGKAPFQLVGDFLHSQVSTTYKSVLPSYRPGVCACDLATLFPSSISSALREALPLLGRKLKGFDHPDAVLTAPETRSSSPIRIPRNETLQSIDVSGIYPCGEGAGYAGGITSAAVDGMRCAEALLTKLRNA